MVLRAAAKNADLGKWADGKRCPKQDYFQSVDGLRVIYRRHAGNSSDDPNYPLLARQVARLLHKEESLYGHLVRNQQETDDLVKWTQLCLAAAYVILERYDEAVANGEWEPVWERRGASIE